MGCSELASRQRARGRKGLSLILMSFPNEGRISARDERVAEGAKLKRHRFLFNGEIMESFYFSSLFCSLYRDTIAHTHTLGLYLLFNIKPYVNFYNVM